VSPTTDLVLVPGHVAAGGPGWAADVVTETVTPSPSDDPLRPELEPTDVSPGLAGFLAIFIVALATVGLFFALSRQLRRMRHNADVQGIGPDGPLEEGQADAPGEAPSAGPVPDGGTGGDTSGTDGPGRETGDDAARRDT
jgi:hypothetical protein